MEPYTVVFVGPQGSGKGTQVEKLKTVFATNSPERKLMELQTGNLFRELVEEQKTFAQIKIKKTLSEGILQPNFLTYALWGQKMLDGLDPESHLLIDGFPRTLDQADTLSGAFEFFERKNLHVINLDTPEEIVRKRMFERARADDTAESVEARLRWYREETIPVINYYKDRKDTFVHNIDGTVSIEEVHAQILSALKLI